jgi:hypothetical protein
MYDKDVVRFIESMNSSAGKGLKANPFVTVRDPQTGQWQVYRPDDRSSSLNANSSQSSQSANGQSANER